MFERKQDVKVIPLLFTVVVIVLVLFVGVVSANVVFGAGEDCVKVVDGGIDDINNDNVASMAIYDGYLYLGLNNEVTGGEVWRVSIVDDQLGTDWAQVNKDGFGDSDNNAIRALQVFEDRLYAGTRNSRDGCELWRTGAVGGPPFTDWTQVGGNGLGRPANNKRVNSMAVYGGELYAGTTNTNKGCQVFKSSDGTTWTRVGTLGFDDQHNTIASWMIAYNGYLHVGTRNEDTGVQIWRSAGVGGPPYTDWEQVNIDGFGSSDNLGAMSMAVTGGQLYVGTFNDTGTGELWCTPNGTSWNNVPISGFEGNERISTMIAGSPVHLGTGNPNGAEFWVYTAPEPELSVGGEAYPINKVSVLAPWILVGMLFVMGISFYVLKRRRTQS